MPKDNLEKIFEAPAVALEKGIAAAGKMEHAIAGQKPVKLAGQYWQKLGPGLTVGAADDDPSGIATYSQAGAGFGFQFLWTALFSFPLMAVVQEMCARIGLVTGRGLAANIRQHYPRGVLYICTSLLVVANIFNIGVDLGAMAKATQLLVPAAHFGLLVVVFAGMILLLEIFVTYAQYAKYLKYLALVLFAYVLSALSVHLNWSTLAVHTLIPSLAFSRDQLLLVCGILGTTISPYLFFWQTSQEIEEQILHGKTSIHARRADVTLHHIADMRLDVWSGMFISNLVMFFIIAAGAVTLFAQGVTVITTAADAALALKPIAGPYAFFLFAVGIIGTGMLAIPVLAGSAAYAVSESFGWKFGLYRKLKAAHAFYGCIILSILIGLGLNFFGIDPIRGLIYAAILNGLVAPVVLFLIVRMSSNKKIMGPWANGGLAKFCGWLITLLMILSGTGALVVMFS